MGNVRLQTRRQLLMTAFAGVTGAALGAPALRLAAAAQPAPAGGAITRLADELFVITIPGQANVVAHVAGDGVTLVDGGGPGATDAIMQAVAGLPRSGPVRTLFNTHWHPEQTGSNATLGQAGRRIIAHENTRLWLATDVTWPWNGRHFTRLPKAAQPNDTFYTTGTLESGIRYGYIPDAAHTDGDLYVLFPDQNVLAVGDVMSGDGWPVVDYATGGWIGGIAGALERVQALVNDDTRIVPGRGRVLSVSDLKAQSAMYLTIYDRLAGLLNHGRGPDEAVAAHPAKEFEPSMGNSDEFVRRAFESLWGYLSPDA